MLTISAHKQIFVARSAQTYAHNLLVRIPAIRTFSLKNADFWLTLQKMAHPSAKKHVNLGLMYQDRCALFL
jgi:hypothetical protein